MNWSAEAVRLFVATLKYNPHLLADHSTHLVTVQGNAVLDKSETVEKSHVTQWRAKQGVR